MMMRATRSPAFISEALLDPTFQRVFQSKRIHLVAPGSGASLQTIEHLRHLSGLTLDIPSPLITDENMFHASSDDMRFLQLKTALFDANDQSVIWTLRGGYGSARLLDRLQALTPPRQEKIVIGFSDNTALHLFFSQCWNWRTIHASGMAQLFDSEQDPQNYIRLAELLDQPRSLQTINHLKPLNKLAIRTSPVSGRMQGGNLTLVESSLGTSWQIKTQGTLLFLEEVGEKGYRIDRSLTHLRQAGLFEQVNGIVFGECLGPDEKGITFALERFAYETSIPVYQTRQFGHGKMNYPITYQSMAEIVPNRDAHDYALVMQVDQS